MGWMNFFGNRGNRGNRGKAGILGKLGILGILEFFVTDKGRLIPTNT